MVGLFAKVLRDCNCSHKSKPQSVTRTLHSDPQSSKQRYTFTLAVAFSRATALIVSVLAFPNLCQYKIANQHEFISSHHSRHIEDKNSGTLSHFPPFWCEISRPHFFPGNDVTGDAKRMKIFSFHPRRRSYASVRQLYGELLVCTTEKYASCDPKQKTGRSDRGPKFLLSSFQAFFFMSNPSLFCSIF